MTRAIFDINDQGRRLTISELFAHLGLCWDDGEAHDIAALGVGDDVWPTPEIRVRRVA